MTGPRPGSKRYEREVREIAAEIGPMRRPPDVRPKSWVDQCFWCLGFFGPARRSQASWFGRYVVCDVCMATPAGEARIQ